MSTTVDTSTRFVVEQTWEPELPWDWNFYRQAVKSTGRAPAYFAPAAMEILADRSWSAKIERALVQSREGQFRGLEEFRKTLES
jgi:hypothetical protein